MAAAPAKTFELDPDSDDWGEDEFEGDDKQPEAVKSVEKKPELKNV